MGEDFSGTVTGVASFGIFVTLDTLHVEGLVHVSELGGEYFQFNDALHELRGERTGMRYRLTDKVQVQVSRVDLEARRIEFRLVQGTSFDALRKAAARGRTTARARAKGGGAAAGGPEGPDRARCAAPRPRRPAGRKAATKGGGPPGAARRRHGPAGSVRPRWGGAQGAWRLSSCLGAGWFLAETRRFVWRGHSRRSWARVPLLRDSRWPPSLKG